MSEPKIKTNFFLQIHRSIFDPFFYVEVMQYRRKQVIKFVLKILLLSTLVSSAAHFFYLIDSQRGIAPGIEKVFGNMQIKDGTLDPGPIHPYTPPGFLVQPLLNRILGVPHPFSARFDSAIIVDTGIGILDSMAAPLILMKSRAITVIMKPGVLVHMPYRALLLGSESLVLNAESVRKFLIQNAGSILLINLFMRGAQIFSGLLFSIFFLAISAYIFRIDKSGVLRKYLRIACFASTPVSVGSIIVALSGVQLSWGWHVFMFVSTIAMFRGIVAVAVKKQQTIQTL